MKRSRIYQMSIALAGLLAFGFTEQVRAGDAGQLGQPE